LIKSSGKTGAKSEVRSFVYKNIFVGGCWLAAKMQNLRRIFQDIRVKIEHNYVESIEEQQQFTVRLKSLDFLERAVLADKVYELEWNLGSSGVFSSLQSLGIVEISVLILRQTDPESVENILNDLIEHSPSLFASLINAYCCPSKGQSDVEYFSKFLMFRRCFRSTNSQTTHPFGRILHIAGC
jgi:hypothetical protein